MISSQQQQLLDREYNAFLQAGDFDKDVVYRQRSAAALQRLPSCKSYVYDPASGATLDYYAAGSGPLFVWIHGGYWRSSSKSENVFIAPGLVQSGINVASIDYSLAPSVSMGEIVRQVRQSIAWLYEQAPMLGFDRTRFHIGGHSAGGHLVGMLLADGWREAQGLPHDLFGVALAVSGLFDLEPMRHTFVNEALKLTSEEIATYSPIRQLPAGSTTYLLATYGGKESAEFARQTDEYLEAWRARSGSGLKVEMPEHHHFDIILQLENAGNPLFDTLLAQIQREPARDEVVVGTSMKGEQE